VENERKKGRKTMTTELLIQEFVTVQQISAIFEWNRKRNGLKFNKSLEESMLREEVREFFEAETIVDQADALFDTLFVAVGTKAKLAARYGNTSVYSREDSIDDFLPVATLEFMLKALGGALMEKGMSEGEVRQFFVDGLNIVISANQSKSTKKDKNGKVIKPKNFKSPESKIKRLMEDILSEGEPDRHDGEAMNAGRIKSITPEGGIDVA
jgi:hypothetical protein